MDITRHNWNTAASVVEAAICECDFMAIDAEMTGLPAHLQNPLQVASSPASQTLEGKFREWRKAVTKLLMVQFGLTTFHWHPERKAYLAKPFNFYIFPSDGSSPFLSSPSSMRFLASRGFDFNRLFVDGLDSSQIHTVTQWMAISKKPLVGHNAFLDVMYLMKALYQPLPEKMEAYRQLLHASFPLIIDTKYFAVASPSISCLLPSSSLSLPSSPSNSNSVHPNTSLGDLCHLVSTLPRVLSSVVGGPTSDGLASNTAGDHIDDVDIDFAPGFEGYRHRQRYHEAGYDAFMAGVVYARLAQYELSTSLPAAAGGPVATAEAVAAYVNRLWWGRKTLFFACEPREETLTRIIAMVRPDGHNANWIAAQLLAVSTPATLDALAKALCTRAASLNGPPPVAMAALCTALVRDCPAFQPFLMQRCRDIAIGVSTPARPSTANVGWSVPPTNENAGMSAYAGPAYVHNPMSTPMQMAARTPTTAMPAWGAGPVAAGLLPQHISPAGPRRNYAHANAGGMQVFQANPNAVNLKQFSEFLTMVWSPRSTAASAHSQSGATVANTNSVEPATPTSAAAASAVVMPAAS